MLLMLGRLLIYLSYCRRLFIDILGHSQGIICLSFEHGSIVLANPPIGEFRELPKASINIRQKKEKKKKVKV